MLQDLKLHLQKLPYVLKDLFFPIELSICFLQKIPIFLFFFRDFLPRCGTAGLFSGTSRRRSADCKDRIAEKRRDRDRQRRARRSARNFRAVRRKRLYPDFKRRRVAERRGGSVAVPLGTGKSGGLTPERSRVGTERQSRVGFALADTRVSFALASKQGVFVAR